MASKGQQNGMRAVFLVAAKMVNHGFIVSPTSRNAFGADLLVTDESCTESCSVQVKANGVPTNFWLLSEKSEQLSSPTHFYVFVNLARRGNDHEYYVVPSRVVKQGMLTETSRTTSRSVFRSFSREKAVKFKDAWDLASHTH